MANLTRFKQFQLPALLILALLALLLLLRVTAIYTEHTSLENLNESATQRLGQFVNYLNGELAKYEFLPEVLATEDSLVAPLINPTDNAGVHLTNQYLKSINDIINAADTYLMDPTGLTVAASNWDAERPFVGRNFNYRPYFKEAMKGHLGRYYALGTTSQKRGYYFAYPIRRDEKILGIVVVKVNMDAIETIWQSAADEFIVTDPDGVIFLTTKPEWKFKSLHVLPDKVLQRIQTSLRYSNAEISPLPIISKQPFGENDSIVTIQETHPIDRANSSSKIKNADYLMQGIEAIEAGWTLHILSSLKPVQEQVQRSMLLAGFVYALFISTALFFVQRRKKMLYKERARKALETSEARIHAIIHNTRAGLITMDQKGNVEFFNPTAEQLFGHQFNEVVDRPFFQLIHPKDQDLYQQQLVTTQQTGKEGTVRPTIEVSGKRNDGTYFPMELTVAQMVEDTGYKYIATIYDITERKQSEEELRRARDTLETRVKKRTEDLSKTNERLTKEIDEHRRTEKTLRQTQDELIHAAKLAGLGQMSTAISHEINQPLSAIRSYADNAQTLLNHERKQDVQWNLTQISQLTARMAQIIKQLKMFARKSPGQSVAVSLQAVFDESLSLLESKIKRDEIKIVKKFPPEELFVLGDMVRLEQVFVNLISNAIQAMNNIAPRILYLDAYLEDNTVAITVRDTGPGIPKNHLASIFDPFFTTKEAGQGLGLGLAISYRIIDGLGGTIQAENNPTGGAMFTVKLPKTNPEARI